jgi:PST family polysaccharide transporter
MNANEKTAGIAKRAIHGVVWTTIGNYAVQALAFAALLVLRSWLDPAVFGVFDVATFWCGLLGIRSKLGLHYGAVRQPRMDGALVGTQLSIDAATGAVGILIAAAAGPALAAHFGYDSTFVLALLVLFASDAVASLGGAFATAMERELQFRTIQLVTLAATLAGYGTALALGGHGFGIISLLVINGVAWSIIPVVTYVICRRRMPQLFAAGLRFDRVIAQALLRDGLATGVSITLLGTIVSQFDNFLNATYVNPTTQGYYGLAFKIANWPAMLVAMVLSRVGYAVMAKVHENRDLLTHTVRLTYWVQGLLAIPFMLTLALHGPAIIRVLYPTGKWDASAEFLPYLAVANMFNIYAGVGYWLAVARGHRRYSVGSSMLQAALLIALGSVFVAQRGAHGTALAVLIAGAVSAVIANAYTLRIVGLQQLWPLATHAIAAAATVGLHLAFVQQRLAPLPYLAQVLVGAAFVGVIYVSAYIALGGRRSIEHLRYLRSRAR